MDDCATTLFYLQPRENQSKKPPGSRGHGLDHNKKDNTAAGATVTAASGYRQRSEAVKFACLSDLPPSMANLLRPEREVQFQAASEEIARLDAELQEAAAKERRVKRDRALQDIRLRHELDQLEAASGQRGHRITEENDNTSKYLALMDSGNALVMMHRPGRDSNTDLQSQAPVLQAECPAALGLSDEAPSNDDDNEGLRFRLKQRRSMDRRLAGSAVASANRRTTPVEGKDFVQQNIQLASSLAKAAVPMTSAERTRIDELLLEREEASDDSDSDVPTKIDGAEDDELSMWRCSEAKKLVEIEAKLTKLGKVASKTSGSP